MGTLARECRGGAGGGTWGLLREEGNGGVFRDPTTLNPVKPLRGEGKGGVFRGPLARVVGGEQVRGKGSAWA